MAKTDLKVTDLIPFSEKDFKELKSLMEELSELTKEYTDMPENETLDDLERIKRQMIGKLERYTVLYSQVRAYKDGSHEYLNEQRKRIKSQAVKVLLDTKEIKNSITKANALVYDSEYYKERVDFMESVKKFFIKVDSMYGRFEGTLRAISQSISVLSKEKSMSN